jgi:hypothetical protein
MPDASATDRALRLKALIALAVAVLVGVAAWVGLSTATQRGINRLAAIDRVRGRCTESWAKARTRADTLLVDRIALPDTIDPTSEDALTQCGDLRDKSAAAQPNVREMNGEPMPRGLR